MKTGITLMRNHGTLFLIILIFLPITIWGQTTKLKAKEPYISFEYYIDSNNLFTYPAILALSSDFKPLKDSMLQSIYKYTYWLKGTVHNEIDTNHSAFLRIGNLDEMTFYSYSDSMQNGRIIHPDNRIYKGYPYFFPIHFHKQTAFYIKINNRHFNNVEPIQPELYNHELLQQFQEDNFAQRQSYNYLVGILCGMLLAFMAYPITLYVFQHEKYYLYYIIYIFCSFIFFLLTFERYAHIDILLSYYPYFLMSFEREINSIHVFFYLLFLFSFFKNQPKTNLLTKGLKWLLYYYIFIMIVNYSLKFMLSDIYFLERNMIIGLIGSVSIGILSTIFIFRIPTIDSTLIGIGFTLYLIGMGVTVYFVYGNSMLPNNFWIENPNIFYLLGILGELFFFSLALSFRNNATIKKQQNEKNELQNRHQINLAKTKLYTNITHEFRTPLTVILGLTEQIRINPKFKLKERLQIIKGNGHRLLKLINELLDLSKLDSGNMLLSYKQGNIIAFLGFLCNSFKNLASAKHIHLTYYAEESALIMDYDEEKLQQIISNLLHNAIKFTAEYGEITLAVKKIEQSLQISVQDNGFGIPFDKQAKIFDRFYQINSAYIQENDGTGIGLALVKELVLLMKGEINIFSEPEKGTTFIITLPILNKAPFSAEHSTEMTAISSVSNEFPAQNKVIFKELPLLLLVEDNADVVYFLKNCLNSKYETIIAKDGQEGFELAKEFLPDLIITDIMMPKINGFELTQLLKADDSTKDIPILISTAKATRKDRLKGLKLGAIEYIFKPFSQEELLIGVEKALKFGGSNKELEKRNALPTEEMVFIEKLYQTVEENLEKEAFNTHDLAKAMMMSRTQLYRKTKAYNNQSPSFLIRKIRLEKAQNLLIDSNLSIGRIAQQTGFRDQSYFTKVFSKVYHLTPSEYRNNNKKTTV